MTRLLTLTLLLAALLVSACGSDDEQTAEQPSGGAQTEAQACEPGRLATKQRGTLTIGTDKPAYPPYFEDDDPTNGRGFESAVAYAIAKELGFSRDKVKWTVVPFNASYAPGPKDFDFDVNQISITDERARQVDFSEPYFSAPQAVVLPEESSLESLTSVEDLANAKLGVQVGTTSLDAVREVVRPNEDPQVYNDSNDVVQALKQNRVDAVVVDLPTAFYLTAAQVEGSRIAGQFEAPGGDRWGALLEKDSALTPCVSSAVRRLRDSGELDRLEDRWLGEAAGAPKLD
jgi:polar amino acid transport system substrate-binding protein